MRRHLASFTLHGTGLRDHESQHIMKAQRREEKGVYSQTGRGCSPSWEGGLPRLLFSDFWVAVASTNAQSSRGNTRTQQPHTGQPSADRAPGLPAHRKMRQDSWVPKEVDRTAVCLLSLGVMVEMLKGHQPSERVRHGADQPPRLIVQPTLNIRVPCICS